MTPKALRSFAVWTPELNTVNGQNIVTRRVVRHQAAFISRVYEYPSGGGWSILVAIWTALWMCIAVIRGYHGGVYLVCSRSTLGFLRDVLPLALSRFGYRVVVHVHGSDFSRIFSRFLIGRFAYWLYRHCEVIVPSDHLLLSLGEISFRKLSVCENFADTPRESHEGAVSSKCRSEFVVLWNSNLMSSKGIVELVDALRILHQEGLAVKLVVLGAPTRDSEATKAKMANYIATLNSESWIEFHGLVPPEKAANYVVNCDAVALPSTYTSECQPLSVAQAMLAGRIVLVAPTDALRATVSTYPAVFSIRDAHAIADALRPNVMGKGMISESLDREIRKAQKRFSPEAFDSRIFRILAR